MHLHDAIGHSNHLPLGEGEIDIVGIVNLVGDSINSVILETKTIEGLKKSVEFFRKLSSKYIPVL
jgi:sugar phosphate isomerase/epimerase